MKKKEKEEKKQVTEETRIPSCLPISYAYSPLFHLNRCVDTYTSTSDRFYDLATGFDFHRNRAKRTEFFSFRKKKKKNILRLKITAR